MVGREYNDRKVSCWSVGDAGGRRLEACRRARPEREVSGMGRVADPRRGMGAQRQAQGMWCILDKKLVNAIAKR